MLVPGVGMFSFGPDAATARVAGEFYVNAINVMRGAEALSTYAPVAEAEKFRIEYWALEEAKLRRRPAAEAAGRPGRARHRRGVRASAGPSPSGWPPRARRWSSPTSTVARSEVVDELGGPDHAAAVEVDVTDEAVDRGRVRRSVGAASAASTSW